MLWMTDSAVLAAMVSAPAMTALLAFLFGKQAPRALARLGAVTAGAGFAGAAVLAVGGSRGQSASVTLGIAEFGVDRLSVILLLLVFGVSGIVQAFAVRYLAGDPRSAWFTGGAGLLTTASAGLATASTLVTLALCWTLAGAALVLLLATYWHLPAARDGVRRTVIAFVIGDLALWAAVAVATATWGRIDLRAGGEFSGPVVAVLGVLVVLAALSRSSQVPFHRWLPATLAAPTPVSALLHAGVVNAGGILLIRLAPLSADGLAQALTILAGAATMVYGTTIMLVKPDIKGALAHSTTAQMGFMILTCGLGLWAAAVIHLVAHGFYKATLFLSSGSAISRHRRHESLPSAPAPSGRQWLARAAAAVVLPGLALGAAVAVVPTAGGNHAAEQALLIFAWATGAAVMWGWLQRCTGAAAALSGAVLLIPAAVGYVAIVHTLSGYLAPALPPTGLSATSVWLLAAAALAVLGGLTALRRSPGAVSIQQTLYTGALGAGHISPALTTGGRS